MSRISPWYTTGHEEYVPPGFALPRQVSSPIPIPPSTLQLQSRWTPKASPPSSTASESYSDDLSHASLQSTAPSTAPSSNPPVPMNPINHGYDFPCEFVFVGCNLAFHPSQFDLWISHSASHFIRYPPPLRTCCTFCDRVFETDNPDSSWRQRMRHIADHFQNFERQENMRPDFFVIEYMWKNRLLSAEDYKWAIQGTERPECDGLVDFGYKPPEMKRKEDRKSEQRHDLEKENRQRRRERDSRGKGKGKGK